ncbi:MAG: signal peptidase II [bacterium]|nr:signal peptidase II [bacterium]
MEVRHRQPRTSTLWTLAILIVIADQLSKAWFVFKLGNIHGISSFGEFLPQYLAEFNTSSDKEFSIIYTKYYDFLRAGDINVFGDWVRFYLTTNTGAAWSIFAGNSFALSFVSLAIAALLYFVWRRNFIYHRAMTIAIGAIIGGALGNCIDRFRLREVVDFIAVQIPYIGKLIPKMGDPYHFPIFNIADASAVCGTLVLAGYLLWLDLSAGKRKRAKELEDKRHDAWKGGIQLDEEALENLRKLDTKSVPPWSASMNSRVTEEEEIGTNRAERVVDDASTALVPELTTDYQPTASALEEMKKESEEIG